MGSAPKAIEMLEEARSAFRDLGEKGGECNALEELGHLHDGLSQFDKAIAAFEQQLVLSRELPDSRFEGIALGGWRLRMPH